MFDFNKHPPNRDLRIFAVLQFVFFLFVATACVRHGLQLVWAGAVVAASCLLALLGLCRPKSVRPVYVGWMYVVAPIGAVVSHAVLALVWLLVFTPVGLTLRLLGRDPLARRFDPKAATYWARRESDEDVPLERYFRQY